MLNESQTGLHQKRIYGFANNCKSQSSCPYRGRIVEVGTFFTNLNNLINKTSEFEARLNANSSLSTSDWNSLQLTTLRDSVSNLDYSHPVRNFIEQKLLDGIDTRLKGLEKEFSETLTIHSLRSPGRKIFQMNLFMWVHGNSFDDSTITSELQYCLFTCPGAIYSKPNSSLTIKPLLKTRGGQLSGTTSLDNFWTGGVFGTPRRFNPDRTLYPGSGQSEVIAAEIKGSVLDGNNTNQMNVILVADIDVLADPFFNIRSRGPESDFPLDVDNVTLSLNLIDSLAKEDKLLDIRNRRRLHRTLQEFEKSIEEAREVATQTIQAAENSIQQILQEENRKLNEALAEVQNIRVV